MLDPVFACVLNPRFTSSLSLLCRCIFSNILLINKANKAFFRAEGAREIERVYSQGKRERKAKREREREERQWCRMRRTTRAEGLRTSRRERSRDGHFRDGLFSHVYLLSVFLSPSSGLSSVTLILRFRRTQDTTWNRKDTIEMEGLQRGE